MKSFALILSIAVSGLVLTSDVTPAFATKMDGKCCTSSDGGRSYRYRMATRRTAVPHTCSAYAASCVRISASKVDRFETCEAARGQCMQTGVYVGPYSRRQYAGMQRM
jgi:hypothetical protein